MHELDPQFAAISAAQLLDESAFVLHGFAPEGPPDGPIKCTWFLPEFCCCLLHNYHLDYFSYDSLEFKFPHFSFSSLWLFMLCLQHEISQMCPPEIPNKGMGLCNFSGVGLAVDALAWLENLRRDWRASDVGLSFAGRREENGRTSSCPRSQWSDMECLLDSTEFSNGLNGEEDVCQGCADLELKYLRTTPRPALELFLTAPKNPTLSQPPLNSKGSGTPAEITVSGP